MNGCESGPRRRSGTKMITVMIVVMVTGLAAAAAFSSATVVAQPANTAGVIAGSVTADRGEVRALRVKARDTVHRISYTVFTQKGRYAINNLPPSSYDVQVLETDFESPVVSVAVKAGATAAADIALKARSASGPIGAGAAQAAGQEGYRGSTPSTTTPAANDGQQVELVDFDALYPPGHGRDLLLKNCFGCHGLGLGWHNRGRKTQAQWRTAVNRMFRADHRIADLAPGVPLVTPDRVSDAEREEIIKYLTANFGPGYTKPRDLKMDALVRDEAALATVRYVQYEVPPPPSGQPFPNTQKPALAGLHDVHVSTAMPGVVWLTGNQSNTIVKLDTRNADYEARVKRWTIPHPRNWNVIPHGIIEEQGKVYWAELGADRIGTLDPASSQFNFFRLPTEGGGAHTLRADSKGNIWYTNYAATGKVGRVNYKTNEVREYEVVKSFSGYGMTVDKQDRAWFVGLNSPVIIGYDPKTDAFINYPISNPARRPTVDSKGHVWAAEFFGNRIAEVNPETGKVTEYELPLRYGNPYELIVDANDDLYIENGAYSALVKFEQKTKKFTYIPYPEMKGSTVKFERDANGTIYFIMPYGGRVPSGLTGFDANGNVPAGR
jgi:streptogramin lyase/mono/diheme cytochrome c family protein